MLSDLVKRTIKNISIRLIPWLSINNIPISGFIAVFAIIRTIYKIKTLNLVIIYNMVGINTFTITSAEESFTLL